MNHVLVREADSHDLPILCELLAELGYPTSVDQLGTRLAAVAGNGSQVIVAEVADRVVGLAAAHPMQPLEQDEPVCVLLVLVVAAAARRHGVGGRLVDAVERLAEERGCEAVLVATPSHRLDAQRFYARQGYQMTGPRLAKVIR